MLNKWRELLNKRIKFSWLLSHVGFFFTPKALFVKERPAFTSLQESGWTMHKRNVHKSPAVCFPIAATQISGKPVWWHQSPRCCGSIWLGVLPLFSSTMLACWWECRCWGKFTLDSLTHGKVTFHKNRGSEKRPLVYDTRFSDISGPPAVCVQTHVVSHAVVQL